MGEACMLMRRSILGRFIQQRFLGIHIHRQLFLAGSYTAPIIDCRIPRLYTLAPTIVLAAHTPITHAIRWRLYSPGPADSTRKCRERHAARCFLCFCLRLGLQQNERCGRRRLCLGWIESVCGWQLQGPE